MLWVTITACHSASAMFLSREQPGGGALPDIIAGYSRGSFMWDERIISLLFHAIFVAVSLYLWMLFFWKGAVSLLILLDTVLTMDAGSVEPLDSPT